jgi:hypothetical protein
MWLQNAPVSPNQNTVDQNDPTFTASTNPMKEQGPSQSGGENTMRTDQPKAQPPPAKKREEIIEDELLELKKKLGLG